MNFSTLILVLLAGLVLTALFQLGARLLGSGKHRALRTLGAIAEMKAKGLTAPPGPDTITVPKDVLADLIDSAARRSSLAAWVQNFLWFVVGSGISIFSNEIRGALGLG